MSLVNSLFEKAKTKITSVISLDELAYGSFNEFCEKVGETLNYTESQLLYGAAEEAYQYKAAERRKRLVRANPQLRQAKSLDIQPLESDATEKSSHRTKRAVDVTNKGDEDRLLNRDHQYVPAGHVASMFSPAAYLAELYKNALYLHDKKNARSLKKRRPDLASLTLSQDNLDKEVSTLSLSNELLLQGCQEKSSELTSKEKVLAHLSTHRLSGSTPYHHAFQTLRHSVIQGKMTPEAILAAYAEIAPDNKTIAKSHMGIFANIDPELCRLLTEEITEQNVGELFKKNFGIDCTTSTASASQSTPSDSTVPPKADLYRWLLNTHNLAKYYDIPVETVEKVLSATSPKANNIDLYIEGKYTQAIISGTKLSGVQIIRTPGDNYSSQLYYANLIPSGGKYSLKIKPRSWADKSSNQLYIYQNNSNQDVQRYVDTDYGAATEKEIIVDNLDTKNGTRFYLTRNNSSSYINAGVDFNVTEITDVRFFLLKLNKLLRLSKATGLSPTEIERIILAHNTEMNVDASVIASLFSVVRYQQRYNLATEEAVILYGASLSQHTMGETRSQFDRLFNQVPCSENTLAPNDQLKINLNPDNKDNQDWKSALKQALQVNDDALLFMAGSEKCTLSLSNLTQLYFIHLLARVHDLTINQTVMLLKILGYNPEDKNKWKPTNFPTIVEVVYQATQWLSEEALTVEQLFLMTTTTFSSQQTPQMTTLVQELRDNKTDDNALHTAMSRSVGTALGINNLNITENILIWLDTVTPTDKLNCKRFIEEIKSKESKTTIKLSEKVIEFCQRIGQLAMIVQWLKLDELETTLIARYPKKVMGDSVTSISLTPTVFRQLSHLRRFLSQCERSAPAVTTALVEDNLTLDLLAGAIGEEKNTLQAAGQQHIDAKISDFSKINDILHVLYLGKALGVSPLVVQSLQSLTYGSNYQNIQWVADSLLAGLEASARQSVNNALEENLSAALSAYYIRTVLPAKEVSWVNSRDDLYQYLLIDNQVSSEMKTSPIAQAISSIQLYIDNCLNDPESNASTEKRVGAFFTDWDRCNKRFGAFFTDWDRCNKRYSQWAATKRLLYYPENYLDPTQRVGQTNMMDRLLQSISQSQLNNDTVEDAFKNYLTDFEHIANLSIVSAYHDDIDTKKGLTYLIGVSQTEPKEYYWRSVNHNKFRENKFPASAWSEWKKIDTTLNPIGNLIRPVMYFSRLYILWVEQHAEAKNNKEIQSPGQSQNTIPTIIYSHNLKLSHLRHDGTWSPPFIFPLENKLQGKNINQLAISCSHCENDSNLMVIIYEKKDSYNENDNKYIMVFSISNNMKLTFIDTEEEKNKYINSILNTLDTPKLVRMDNKQSYIKTYEFHSKFGEYNLRIFKGLDIKFFIRDDDLFIYMYVRLLNKDFYKTHSVYVNTNINGKESRYDLSDKVKTDYYPDEDTIYVYVERINLSDFTDGENFNFNLNVDVDSDSVKAAYKHDIITLKKKIKQQQPDNVLSIMVTPEGNQHLQLKEARLALLNTLFAKKLVQQAWGGVESVLNLETQNLIDTTERLDFTGANALYLWEMFYYVPMMVTRRLLQEQQFDEAARWLKYIYSSSGYWVKGTHHPRCWNVRPLLEDTGWDSVPSDITDPDAVAQHEPMHYKLMSFMCQLDLLIARGDAAYRILERDTLVEAMMWYQQALNLLGPLPPSQQQDNNLPNLTLQSVVDKKSAPSIFQPEENTRLTDYRKTLAQRIYNLRHNLNIDGQPLFLPLYAKPANPQDLRSALVVSTGSSPALPEPTLSLYRFPLMLERARSMVSQLSQFGTLLSNILERQDAEALSALIQNQAKALFMMSAGIQNQTLEELIAEKEVLVQQQTAARQRLEHYQGLYEENINAGENDAMAARLSAGQKALTATGLHMVAAGLDLAPNIFGFSVGGSRWGALATAGALGENIWSSYEMNNADNTTLKESYRRRREEWDIQRKTAQTDVNQLEAQMKARNIRYQAAVMQKTYLETQQKQAQEQLEFLQRKFSNQALYSWLRGRLTAIYYQFYDLTMSRCLMAEAAYHYEVKGGTLKTPQFIKPGAWQSAHAGLLCGEALTLNLAQMEDDYLKWESRALEVDRTVSLAQMYASLGEKAFVLPEQVERCVNKKPSSAGTAAMGIKLENEDILRATVSLPELKLADDYPDKMKLGNTRRIKQISVTLPALLGPYQDIQATLSYSDKNIPKGCQAIAVSRGMNDSGLFQLDFNDGKFLPFEGIPVNDSGVFTLSFPQATGKQKALLLSLSDIILHIRYTIRD